MSVNRDVPENVHVQENFYDAENFRYGIMEDGERTDFVSNGWDIYTELDDRDKRKNRLVRGIGIVATDQEVRNGTESGSFTYSYYHGDVHNDICYITGEDGFVKNQYEYDVFGGQTRADEIIRNRYKYNGEQYDEVTEQYYLRARFYNPVAARFTQEDIYRGDGLNLYAYCGNNAVVYEDPSGYESRPGDYNFIGPVSIPELESYYANVRAYKGVDISQIPYEYRTPVDSIIEMDFKGKVKGGSGRNAAGWERNSAKYFKELNKQHPEFFSPDNQKLIAERRVPKINEQYVEYFPQYRQYIGEELRHHHIGEGGQACALPKSLHLGYGIIHNVEKQFGVTGNDYLTNKAQSVEEVTRSIAGSDQKRIRKCSK